MLTAMGDWACLEAREPEAETLFGYPVVFTDMDTPEDWTIVLDDWRRWVRFVWKPKAAKAEKERQP